MKTPLLNARPKGRDLSFTPEVEKMLNLLILSYELGEVIHNFVYGASAWYNKKDEKVSKAFMENAKYEMADAITMVRSFCERMEWSYEELVKVGEERYLERMQEIKEKVV